jgi:hypothetical protein
MRTLTTFLVAAFLAAVILPASALDDVRGRPIGSAGAQAKHQRSSEPCSPSRIRAANGCSTSRNERQGISSMNANWGATAGAQRNSGANSKHNGKP